MPSAIISRRRTRQSPAACAAPRNQNDSKNPAWNRPGFHVVLVFGVSPERMRVAPGPGSSMIKP
jgi:hypothetical protein